jgi:hypothetical protein
MTDAEVVLTSRRARWRTSERGWEAGRLRISDRRLRLTALDGSTTEVPLTEVAAVRVTRWPRPALVVVTTDGVTLRIRCFAVPAVATLLLHGSGRISDTPPPEH